MPASRFTYVVDAVEEEHLTFERNAVPPVVTVRPQRCEHIPGKPRLSTEKEYGKSIIDFCMATTIG